MPSQRSALIVACDTYADAQLSQLRAPGQDATALADVLQDPDIGAFAVRVSMNQPHYEVRVALEDFFAQRTPEDVLLLHFSCHGIKDEAGRLFFACSDTQTQRLNATGISSEYVEDLLTQTRSRRVVLLVDCCFSGAFTRGLLARGSHTVDMSERLQGRGRAVLTASSALEYAWEGDTITQLHGPSIFTSAVVQGLRTGEADRDGDQRVSIDELYDYVFDQVRNVTPNQTPGKWSNVEGMLYVARAAPRTGPAVAAPLDVASPQATPAPPTRPYADDRPTVTSAPDWLAAALVGGGWAIAWLVSLALSTSNWIISLESSLLVVLAIWLVLALLVGAGVRWATPDRRPSSLLLIGIGWPICIAIGVAAPLMLGLSESGTAWLGLAVAAAGLLASVAVIPARTPIAWDRVLIVVAAWTAGWLWSGLTAWPAAFWRIANGYDGKFDDLFQSIGFVPLAAGGVLSGILGGMALYLLLIRREQSFPHRGRM